MVRSETRSGGDAQRDSSGAEAIKSQRRGRQLSEKLGTVPQKLREQKVWGPVANRVMCYRKFHKHSIALPVQPMEDLGRRGSAVPQRGGVMVPVDHSGNGATFCSTHFIQDIYL